MSKKPQAQYVLQQQEVDTLHYIRNRLYNAESMSMDDRRDLASRLDAVLRHLEETA